MVALVHDNQAVLGKHLGRILQTRHAGQHRNVQTAGELGRFAAPDADLLSGKTEETHRLLSPLIQKHRAVNQHQCRRTVTGDQGASHDRLTGTRRSRKHAVLVFHHLPNRAFLLRPQFPFKRPPDSTSGRAGVVQRYGSARVLDDLLRFIENTSRQNETVGMPFSGKDEARGVIGGKPQTLLLVERRIREGRQSFQSREDGRR